MAGKRTASEIFLGWQPTVAEALSHHRFSTPSKVFALPEIEQLYQKLSRQFDINQPDPEEVMG